MLISTEYIYLIFNVYSQNYELGQVQILIHTLSEMEKWKNPYLCENEVINYFRDQCPEYMCRPLWISYYRDMVFQNFKKY